MKKNDYRILALRMIEYLKDRPNHLATKREIADYLGCSTYAVKRASRTLEPGIVVPIEYHGYFLRGKREYAELELEELLLVVFALRVSLGIFEYSEFELGFVERMCRDFDIACEVDKQRETTRVLRVRTEISLLYAVRVLQDKYDYTPRWFVE